ncbi:uncharacterized protein GGS22DRAFT_200103 [Annulohypoxylon maeteangense]|uniref:uncharacterized protein n=1 Tax=Annulohypoxylon maeteangense TaxID=1927788 RepID=UPI002008CF3C|nr:uncharacterized protein GGS22DRAFT_200103 [Annulohypoxylon maeteangense]KAI0885011.1 hypothetical protein GGS22DRAFT_200103 [Annulohypoxylon maeteangense]
MSQDQVTAPPKLNMSSTIPTMDLRVFVPSEQLTGNSSAERQISRHNGNYRGDCSLSINTGANVQEQNNTNLWITGLPGTITIQELLAAITRTGRVRSTVVNAPTGTIMTAAASISFFNRKDAENLYRKIENGRILYRGTFPSIQWNRNKVGEGDAHPLASRVLLIAGDPEIVNEKYLNEFFSKKFVYEIDCIINHGTVDGFNGPISRLEYRFGSWRSQASSARLALTLELKGFLLVEYGPDPCAGQGPGLR